jgi:hypothetical protein
MVLLGRRLKVVALGRPLKPRLNPNGLESPSRAHRCQPTVNPQCLPAP